MPTPYLAPSLQDQGYIGATGTTPYRPPTAEELAQLQNIANDQSVTYVPRTVSSTATAININFDGTQNNGAFPFPGETSTKAKQISNKALLARPSGISLAKHDALQASNDKAWMAAA